MSVAHGNRKKPKTKPKVGDILHVKPYGWYTENASADGWVRNDGCSCGYGFNDEMAEYCGKKAVVETLYPIESGFDIDLDGGSSMWFPWMFEEEYMYEPITQSVCQSEEE